MVVSKSLMLAVVIAAVAGCGGSDKIADPVAGTQPSSAPAAAPSTVATTHATPQATGRCRTKDLRADLTFQSAADGRVNSMLTLTNKSQRSCRVKGHPVVTVYDASLKPAPSLTVPKKWPGAGPSITLKPGITAFAGVQWRSAPSCALAGGIGFSAPDEDGVAKARAEAFGVARWRICEGKVNVGTLQPASQGVNFS